MPSKMTPIQHFELPPVYGETLRLGAWSASLDVAAMGNLEKLALELLPAPL